MNLTWHTASVELAAGYWVAGPDGQPTAHVQEARVAFEGGFAHIEVSGTGRVDVVSAPAIRLITYSRRNRP